LNTVGALSGAPAFACYWRDGNDERNELGYIMGIGRRERRRERDTPCIAEEVVLAACFAPVSGIRSGFFPPCMARTEELSTTVRDHSIWSAACNRVSNTRCNRAHTPARCHATSRLQQSSQNRGARLLSAIPGGHWIYGRQLDRSLTVSEADVFLPALPAAFDRTSVLLITDLHAGPFITADVLERTLSRLATLKLLTHPAF